MALDLIFEYAIKNPDGYYYTGRAGVGDMSPNIKDAYTYTEQGAHAKITRCNWAKDFTVERRAT